MYEFIIMPNHLHGIIIVGATLAVALSKRAGADNERAGASPAPTIGDIVGSFKSLCVHTWLSYKCKNNINVVGKIWQRNYYEHVIRNEKELERIRQYIINNPLQWEYDRENSKSENYNMKLDNYYWSIYE